jgi:hypothetical protein
MLSRQSENCTTLYRDQQTRSILDPSNPLNGKTHPSSPPFSLNRLYLSSAGSPTEQTLQRHGSTRAQKSVPRLRRRQVQIPNVSHQFSCSRPPLQDIGLPLQQLGPARARSLRGRALGSSRWFVDCCWLLGLGLGWCQGSGIGALPCDRSYGGGASYVVIVVRKKRSACVSGPGASGLVELAGLCFYSMNLLVGFAEGTGCRVVVARDRRSGGFELARLRGRVVGFLALRGLLGGGGLLRLKLSGAERLRVRLHGRRILCHCI